MPCMSCMVQKEILATGMFQMTVRSFITHLKISAKENLLTALLINGFAQRPILNK